MVTGYDRFADGIPSGYDVQPKTAAQRRSERKIHEKEVANIKEGIDNRLEEARKAIISTGLRELNSSTNGKMTLEGRVVNAHPIGSPVAYSLRPTYSIGYDIPEIEAHFLTIILKRVPANANAFCRSEFIGGFDRGYLVEIQWYKVKHLK